MENKKDWLDYTKGILEIIFIISTIVFGCILTSSFKDKELKLETLKVAVSILAQNPQKNDPLREWALDVFKKYANPKPPEKAVMILKEKPLGSYITGSQDYMAHGPLSPNNEDGAAPVITKHFIDLFGDNTKELVKVIYGEGVSDKFLTIEVYKDNKLVSTLKSDYGIQSNYKIDDLYHDGKKEIIIWSGLWDFRLPGEDGITDNAYEGHSAPHRYIVAIYRPLRGEYYLWDIYTTKKKYEPYCEEMPVRD